MVSVFGKTYTANAMRPLPSFLLLCASYGVTAIANLKYLCATAARRTVPPGAPASPQLCRAPPTPTPPSPARGRSRQRCRSRGRRYRPGVTRPQKGAQIAPIRCTRGSAWLFALDTGFWTCNDMPKRERSAAQARAEAVYRRANPDDRGDRGRDRRAEKVEYRRRLKNARAEASSAAAVEESLRSPRSVNRDFLLYTSRVARNPTNAWRGTIKK